MTDPTYTVAQVIDRIETELGERPTANRLYKGWDGRRPGARPSIVAGMPAPVSGAKTRLWDAAQVEDWLRHHPRRVLDEARAHLRDELPAHIATPRDRALEVQAMRRARERGMSMAQIAEVVGQARGESVTRQAIAQRLARWDQQ